MQTTNRANGLASRETRRIVRESAAQQRRYGLNTRNRGRATPVQAEPRENACQQLVQTDLKAEMGLSKPLSGRATRKCAARTPIWTPKGPDDKGDHDRVCIAARRVTNACAAPGPVNGMAASLVELAITRTAEISPRALTSTLSTSRGGRRLGDT